MKTQNIVYIADGNSIHDIKWILFFSEQKEKYKCFLICDTSCKLSEKTKLDLTNKNIHLLPQIAPISIKSPIKTLISIKQFKRALKEINPDLVHVLFATPNALWLNFISFPSIITMRGSDILIVIPDLLKQKGIKSFYFKFLYKLFHIAFNAAKVVTGTSLTQISEAKKHFSGINLELVRTGVDVDKISEINSARLIPESLSDKEFVFSPRFMSPIYNVDLQIEAITQLKSEILGRYIFVFIRGLQYDEKYFEKQKQKLNSLKEERNLNYLIFDYLDQPSMWMFLKKASLCMMTPISDGTPNSALEAMAAKCPLIVSNLNYDADLFEGTCIKLKSFNVAELADMIELSLTNYPTNLIEKGFEQVSIHGNRKEEMKKLENLYKIH
jgi:glycosyltransferase involved in cell wall biosynthesis